jgi:sugar-specific transcriptional regulator TrmB
MMAHQKVVDRLVALGLTTYEAKVFSALTGLGEAGVGAIHAIADVPRSAIYGTLEKLERRGIVESSTGRPKTFRAMPPKVALSKIESELLGAAKEAKDGLEELASVPHKEASEARIWVIKGRMRIQERLAEIADTARSELLVAGTPEHILAFSEIWKKARSRKMKVTFATPEPARISALSKYGEIARPSQNFKMHEMGSPKVLFVRFDRRTILFASEYEDETRIEDMMAFWTDDTSVVRFMNYLTDSLTPRTKTARGSA